MSALYGLKIRFYNSLDSAYRGVSVCAVKETRALSCNEVAGSLEANFEQPTMGRLKGELQPNFLEE